MKLYSYIKLSSMCAIACFALMTAMASHADARPRYTQSYEIKDPFETFNRGVFYFNDKFDTFLLRPITKTYRFIVPEIGRRGIRNVLRNLGEPVTFANAVLQGDVEQSFRTFWRFTLNSTIGLGGLGDVMEKHGLPHREEDFGQTLAHYGVGFGPYIVLPLMGPSSGRDAVGSVVDRFSDPFNYILNDEALAIRTGLMVLDIRDQTLDITDEINNISLDPYSTLRSLYTQRRLAAIANQTRLQAQQ